MGCLYIKHEDGAIHALRGKAFQRLLRAFRSDCPGPEVTGLVVSGYVGFLSDVGDVLDFEHLTTEVLEKHLTA